MICITLGVKEVGIFIFLFYLCINFLEEILNWDLICSENILSWIYNRFVLEMYDIFYVVEEIKGCWFYCSTHTST